MNLGQVSSVCLITETLLANHQHAIFLIYKDVSLVETKGLGNSLSTLSRKCGLSFQALGAWRTEKQRGGKEHDGRT